MAERSFRTCGCIVSKPGCSDEDMVFWNGLQMLNSVQGMVERTRQSMAALKDRVHSTHAEMERKEVRN